MWWWWWENNGNVEVLVYSLTIHEAVLKKRVDVGSMEGRYEVNIFVWGKMYKEMRRWMRRRENNEIMEE